MSKKNFTKEQQQLLRQNPYIYSVTDTRINLTKKFKEIFLAECKSGISPRKILEGYGFDISIIGERRIWSISNHIRTEYKMYSEFHEGYRPRSVPAADASDDTGSKNNSDADKIKQLQQDREDFEQILTAYKMHGYSKGAKGIYMALLHMDPPVVMNLKKIRRLMDKFNLSCPYRGPNPYRRMAKSLKNQQCRR